MRKSLDQQPGIMTVVVLFMSSDVGPLLLF